MPEVRMRLPKKVQDAIRETLPGQVSSELRTYLAECEQAATDNIDLLEQVASLGKSLKEHTTLASARRSLNDCQIGIDKQRDELLTSLAEFEVATLKVKLEAEQNYAVRLEGVLAGLVRNTEWRETVHQFERTFNTVTNALGSQDTRQRAEPSDTTKKAE